MPVISTRFTSRAYAAVSAAPCLDHDQRNRLTVRHGQARFLVLAESIRMAVELIRSTRFFPAAPYAYAAQAQQADLIFTAGACPLDGQGQVVASSSR
jgi:hypothetical protein